MKVSYVRGGTKTFSALIKSEKGEVTQGEFRPSEQEAAEALVEALAKQVEWARFKLGIAEDRLARP